MIRFIFTVCFFAISSAASAQVLITLLLGDKLNSDKLEFGLEGGVNFSEFAGLEDDIKGNFNLGFYFDFKLKNPVWKVHTGVIVKSTMGAQGLPVYPLGQQDLNDAFEGGEVVRKINYFNVPVLMKYMVGPQFYVQSGIQLGLRTKAKDIFYQEINKKDDLTFEREISNDYHRIDAGVVGGIGYRLLGGNGMNIGVNYYLGIVDITTSHDTKQYNRSLYFTVGIPIGVKKKNSTPEETD